MSLLHSADVVLLETKIIDQLKKDPMIDNAGPLCMMSWMARHLSKEDFLLLERIELTMGENVSTGWLMGVLQSANPDARPNGRAVA